MAGDLGAGLLVLLVGVPGGVAVRADGDQVPELVLPGEGSPDARGGGGVRTAVSVIAWSLFWAAVVVGGFLLVEEARVWDLILKV